MKNSAAENQTARREFALETAILADLQTRPHRGIIRARFFTTTSPIAIALDFAAGGVLKDFIVGSTVAPKLRVRMATQVASAMAYVHSRGIAHLDLKTANLLLDKDKNVLVCCDWIKWTAFIL